MRRHWGSGGGDGLGGMAGRAGGGPVGVFLVFLEEGGGGEAVRATDVGAGVGACVCGGD